MRGMWFSSGFIVPSMAVLVVLAGGCDHVASEAPAETAWFPIVGGKVETGWTGVGALTQEATGYGYMGSFCSGALIAPQWVLTAGHCLSGQPDMPLFPETVFFYIGGNANPMWYGSGPLEGELVQADAFYIHPGYASGNGSDDIALMHLARPVTTAPSYPINSMPMDKSFINKKVLYVGFGVSDGIKQNGGGIKRSGNMVLYTYEKKYYVSGYGESGVCFGDSGGPGLFEINGETRIIGVNSSVMSRGPDPCTGAAIQTRVDHYADWIKQLVAGGGPDCRVDSGLCWCPVACNGDGSCNNSLCQTLTCEEVRECFKSCGNDEHCKAICYVRATPEAEQKLLDFYWCRVQKCYTAKDVEQCGIDHCGDYLEVCSTQDAGEGDCAGIFGCVDSCDWAGNPECWSQCHAEATLVDQERYDALWYCFTQSCNATPVHTFQPGCGWEQCGYELEVCLPPSDCSVLGGDCESGRACWFSPTNKLDCFPSDGGQEGDSCALVPLLTRPCADGLQCLQVGGNTECRRVCRHPSHCADGEICQLGEIAGLPDYGYCRCVDEDGDGFCSLDDCDDSNAAINPTKGEKCWDGADNNCNGEIDEGCEQPEGEPGEATGTLLTSEQSGCAAGRPAPAILLPLAFLLLLAVAVRGLGRRRTDS